MKQTKTFLETALQYWDFSLCSDPIDGKYEPLAHKFLKDKNPIKVIWKDYDNRTR